MAFDLTELEWAINDVTLPNANGPNKVEPVSALKTSGVDWEQFLPAENFNWLMYKIYKALEDLDSRTVVAGQLPVGSVYMNYSDSRNPGVILGYGTWVSMAGTAVIGAGTHTDVNGVSRTFTAGASGGEYEHILTISEMPVHDHPIPYDMRVGPDNNQWGAGQIGTNKSDGKTSTSGLGQAHENMMPYTVCYMWRRTA